MSEIPNFRNSLEQERRNPFLESLEKYGAKVENDQMENSYIIQFAFKECVITLRIILKDYDGSNLVITNITALPEDYGYRRKVLQNILVLAKENGLTKIKAVQVQKASEEFWIRNSFVKDQEPNECNDYIYQGMKK